METQKPTPLNPERVQQVMRYAVAVAANADDFKDRELGPIHLLKYVYLADLAYAEKHGGKSYTGIPWRFHHFGPWAQVASRQVSAAMAHPAIRHRSFQSAYKDDVSRWSSSDPELEETLESTLPHVVSRAVRLAVKDFGNDTSGLLHHVYRTAPMLRAAPQEQLDLSTVALEEDEPADEPQPEPATRQGSKAARKHRKEVHDELRRRARKALEKRRQRREQNRAKPTHTMAELMEVIEWVDSLTGTPIVPLEGELIVSDDVWKSPARSGS